LACAPGARVFQKGDTIMAEEKVIAEVKAEEVKAEEVKPVEKKATRKAVAKKPAAEKAVAEKAVAEKAVAEKKAPAKKAEKAVAEKKAPAKKAEKAEKAVVEKKAAKKAEKAVAEKKAPAKRAAKKVDIKTNVFVQFAGKSFSQDELVKIAQDVWQYDMNMKAEDFKSVEIYVKPEENTAYFVVNGEFPGSFVL